MERGEVLRLAREAGYPYASVTAQEQEVLERFAALVAAAAADRARQEYEREHCRHVVPLPDALQVMIAESVAEEREACAKVCDKGAAGGPAHTSDLWCQGYNSASLAHAAAIRARGASPSAVEQSNG